MAEISIQGGVPDEAKAYFMMLSSLLIAPLERGQCDPGQCASVPCDCLWFRLAVLVMPDGISQRCNTGHKRERFVYAHLGPLPSNKVLATFPLHLLQGVLWN
jgi:hypothetical protein